MARCAPRPQNTILSATAAHSQCSVLARRSQLGHKATPPERRNRLNRSWPWYGCFEKQSSWINPWVILPKRPAISPAAGPTCPTFLHDASIFQSGNPFHRTTVTPTCQEIFVGHKSQATTGEKHGDRHNRREPFWHQKAPDRHLKNLSPFNARSMFLATSVSHHRQRARLPRLRGLPVSTEAARTQPPSRYGGTRCPLKVRARSRR